MRGVSWQVAQLNVGRLVAPLDHPLIDDFREALPLINALGEASPGFVWRLVGAGDATGATDLRWPDAPDDELFIVNLTVWEDVDSLQQFTHRSSHAGFLRRRREWFDTMTDSHLVLWWVPSGYRPTLADASERLAFLRANGPSPFAFTFGQSFGPESVGSARA